jgi:acetyl esterase
MPKKLLMWSVGVVIVLAIAIFTASQVSPWRSALNYRLYRLTMPPVAAHLNERYDISNPDAILDVYYPSEVENTDRSLPTIVWVHGGAFRAGSKDGIADYLKILAAKNYTLVGVNYSLAPAKIYPTPILQVNAALAFIGKNAARLHVDASKLFLAGDSAGAQIAAQLAVVISNSVYANQMGMTPSIDRRQLKGVILHCGLYDLRGGGETRASIARTYLGNEDFLNDPRLEEFSVVNNITADFPPMFISVGNADRLESQSQLLADTARKLGVSVDSLFFPSGYAPPLPHEYQFSIGSEAGRLALDRTVAFLGGRSH